MDIPNNELDDEIAYALKSQVVVNPAHKQAAWDRLEKAAVQQVILAPYAVPPKISHRHSMLVTLWEGLIQCFAALCTDEASFQRAASTRQNRYAYMTYFGGPYQSILHFSSSIQYAGTR